MSADSLVSAGFDSSYRKLSHVLQNSDTLSVVCKFLDPRSVYHVSILSKDCNVLVKGSSLIWSELFERYWGTHTAGSESVRFRGGEWHAAFERLELLKQGALTGRWFEYDGFFIQTTSAYEFSLVLHCTEKMTVHTTQVAVAEADNNTKKTDSSETDLTQKSSCGSDTDSKSTRTGEIATRNIFSAAKSAVTSTFSRMKGHSSDAKDAPLTMETSEPTTIHRVIISDEEEESDTFIRRQENDFRRSYHPQDFADFYPFLPTGAILNPDIQWPPYPYYITDILLSSTNAPRKNFNPHTIPDGGYYSTLPMFTTTHMFYEKEDLEEVITYRQESYYRFTPSALASDIAQLRYHHLHCTHKPKPVNLAQSPAVTLDNHGEPQAGNMINNNTQEGNNEIQMNVGSTVDHMIPVQGFLSWKMVKQTDEFFQEAIGKRAQELVHGYFDPRTRMLYLLGIGRSLMGLPSYLGVDIYRLQVSEDGHSFNGNTFGNPPDDLPFEPKMSGGTKAYRENVVTLMRATVEGGTNPENAQQES